MNKSTIIFIFIVLTSCSTKEIDKPECAIKNNDSILSELMINKVKCDSSYYFINLPGKIKVENNKIYNTLDNINYREVDKKKFKNIPYGYSKVRSEIKDGTVYISYYYNCCKTYFITFTN